MPRYFLGVDGGQSATTAVIGDETGRVLGEGRCGPSNYPGDPEAQPKFVDAIRTAVATACQSAGLDPATAHFAGACLGLSGGAAGRKLLVSQIIASDRLLLTDDAQTAFSGAFAGVPGIVVIAGTGSIAFGRNATGRSVRAGGWGYVFGDEGGGFWIVRQALRAALRFEEGWGPPTALRAMLLDATSSRNVNHLMHRCYTPEFPRQRIAGLSLVVNQAAEAGDREALAILGAAAHELAALAGAVRSQLFQAVETVRCAPSGGVFHSRLLTARFRSELERQPGLEAFTPLYNPGLGALLQAYKEAGVDPTGFVSHI